MECWKKEISIMNRHIVKINSEFSISSGNLFGNKWHFPLSFFYKTVSVRNNGRQSNVRLRYLCFHQIVNLELKEMNF